MSALHDTLRRHVDAGTVPGAVALVARGADVEVVTVGSVDTDGSAPAARDSIFRIGRPQLRLGPEVPVEGAVADAERAGDVDHGRLGRTMPAQHLLGGGEDALGGQGFAGRGQAHYP